MASAAGKHGSTFGGNPLACAAANAAIDVLVGQKLPDMAEEKGARFVERLRADLPPVVREIRRRGLMIGIELKTRSSPVLKALIDKGVLALPAGNTVVRLLPPLVISEQELSRVCDALTTVLATVAEDRGSP